MNFRLHMLKIVLVVGKECSQNTTIMKLLRDNTATECYDDISTT